MWCGLIALALCGTMALGAHTCRGLPTRPPDGANYLGTPRTLSFRLMVKPGGPGFRITVRSRPISNFNDLVHAGDVEVARCQDGRLLQLLPIMASQPINFAATFRASDINFDGYLDFSVLQQFSAKSGSQQWWIYEPATGRFVRKS
jgi:hypothetical protein